MARGDGAMRGEKKKMFGRNIPVPQDELITTTSVWISHSGKGLRAYLRSQS